MNIILLEIFIGNKNWLKNTDLEYSSINYLNRNNKNKHNKYLLILSYYIN